MVSELKQHTKVDIRNKLHKIAWKKKRNYINIADWTGFHNLSYLSMRFGDESKNVDQLYICKQPQTANQWMTRLNASPLAASSGHLQASSYPECSSSETRLPVKGQQNSQKHVHHSIQTESSFLLWIMKHCVTYNTTQILITYILKALS